MNAVIRAVAKASAKRGWECIGVLGGYEGLLEPQRTMPLDYQILSGLLTRGGTILATANRGKFSVKVGHGESRALPKELLEGVKAGMDALGLFALVSIGGDGTLSIAQQLFEYGIPIVGVPKTIDNDLEGTLFTFGFDSAVTCATDALDRLHTTAESHNRVMVLEVMGRYAGWIALYAGVAGGADVILIPEIPFSYENVCAKIQERENLGKKFTIVVVAESACEKEGGFVTCSAETKIGEARLGGIGAFISAEIEKRTGKESRYACSATFSAADRQPRLIARSARYSARRRRNSLLLATSEKWSRSTGRRSARSKSARPSANSKPCVPKAISLAPLARSEFVSAIRAAKKVAAVARWQDKPTTGHRSVATAY